MRNVSVAWLAGLILFVCPATGFAFDNGPTWFDFHYTLDTPGARTLAMGGAALATVDDAGAVLANPAALVRLRETQLRFDSAYLHRTARDRPGTGNPGSAESIRLGLRVDRTRQLKPALMALAVPLREGRSVFALFYHKLLPYDRSITVTDPLSGGVAETHNVMFDLDEFGFSVAQSLFDGRLALGLSASLVTLNMDIKVLRDPNPAPGRFEGTEFAGYGSQSEQEPLWRLGLLYRPNPVFAVGVRHEIAPNPDFTMTTANSPETVAGGASGGCSGDINLGVLADGTPTGNWICKSSFPLPERTSLGLAYTPHAAWTFTAEASYVDYARVTKELHAPYAYSGGGVTVPQAPEDFEAEAVVELRLGLEHRTRFAQRPLALRCGYYFDPAHDIRYRGADATSRVIYPGGRDVHHVSVGAGLRFAGALQLDAAFAAADDRSQRGALSLAYSY